MARPKKYNLPVPESVTDSINRVEKEFRETDKIRSSVKVPLPNGKFAELDVFVDTEYRAGNYTSIFADPTKYMKEVKEDCMYAWVAYGRPAELMGKIRSGMYRPVSIDEINDEADLPVTHKTVASTEFVTVYDVALVEVQPQAVKRLYKWREGQAVSKTVRNAAYESLKNVVESESGGQATAEMEVKETNFG